MKRTVAAVWVAAAVLMLSACEPIDEGGGAGVDGPLTFTNGYVFVRGNSGDVFLVNEVDPNVTQQLSTPTTNGARHPALSRDGRQVVYARLTGTASELVRVGTAEGSVPTVVLGAAATGGQNLRNPVFSPAGNFIVFVYDIGTTSFLGLVNVDGTGFTQLAGNAGRSYGAPFFVTSASSGTAVLAPAGPSRSELTQLDQVTLSPRSVLTLSNNLTSTDGQLTVVGRVVQSPDGQRLAFDARAGLGATRIYVAAFSGTVVQPADRLTSLTEGQETLPTWVGNARVGFSSSAGGNDNVYTASATVLRGSATLVVPSARDPWFGGPGL